MKNPLNNEVRAKNAIISFYIILGLSVLMLISNFMEYQLLTSSSIGYAEAESNDRRQLIIGLLNAAGTLALIITFIQWFRRGYHNLHKVGEKNLLMPEGWAAGAWFIPIVSLYRPYQIMAEIWDRTKRYIELNPSDQFTDDAVYEGYNKSEGRAVVGLWWAFWIITSVASNISFQIGRKADSVESLLSSNMFSMVSDVAGIVAVVFGVRMIKASQADQNQFFRSWSEKGDSGTITLPDSDEILV